MDAGEACEGNQKEGNKAKKSKLRTDTKRMKQET